MTPTSYRWAREHLGRRHEEMTFIGVSRSASYGYESGQRPIPLELALLLEFLAAHPGDLASLQRRMRGSRPQKGGEKA